MLTVLMATHNGAHTLPRVLDGYTKLDPPRGGWNVVIVNNGSTDETQTILDSFRSRLPLRCIQESKLGKNNALNTGLLNVTGDLVVMTDDDAIPRPDWLKQFRDTADAQPSFSVFGGVIVPNWESSPESWILPFCYILTITDAAWQEGPIPATRIYGPNMAVRSQVIQAGHRFDPSLGPTGSRYQMGDETDFLQRVCKAGFRSWHCQHAVVEHIIRKNQMDQSWMLRRAKASGRAEYRREYMECEQHQRQAPALLFGMPRYIVREIMEQAVRVGVARVIRNSDKIFRERWQLNFLVGRALGGRDLHSAPPPDSGPAPEFSSSRYSE